MEADWSVELGADDPVIVVPWHSSPGFIDLRMRPQSIDEIEEARNRLPLRSALERLNGIGSGLWTAKCDAWIRGGPDESGGAIDPWEMEATAEDARFAAGSYIDILALDSGARGSFTIGERWVRRLAESLRPRELRSARADFVLRRAEIDGVAGFGVTWFVEACGQTVELAELKWAEALAEALPVVLNVGGLGDATMTRSSGE